MIKGKRGQGLSTSTIVLIILAVAVLVILILGFTIGWSSFLPFLKTNNVNNIVNDYKKMTLGSNGGLDASGTVYINNAYDVKKEDPGLSWIN